MLEIVNERELTLVRGGFSAGITSSAQYRVMIVCGGEGRLSLAGRVAEIQSGAVMLLAPYDLLYVSADAAKRLDAYLFTFASEALYRTETALSDVFRGETYLPRADQSDATAALLSRMSDIDQAPETHSASLARLYLTELLLHLSAHPIAFDETLGVARAVRYLAAHMQEDVSLDELSEAVGISKFYLCRAFSRDSGLTPHAYLNHLRAYHAQTLLAGGMSAADAAVSVGFSDYSTFFRTYRKIIGRNPTTREKETRS